jgi:hypothetical protein
MAPSPEKRLLLFHLGLPCVVPPWSPARAFKMTLSHCSAPDYLDLWMIVSRNCRSPLASHGRGS